MMIRTLATAILVACSNSVVAQEAEVYESTLGAFEFTEPIYLDAHPLRRTTDGRPHIADRPAHLMSTPSVALKHVVARGGFQLCSVHDNDDDCRSKPGTHIALTEIKRLPNGQLEVGVAETLVLKDGRSSGRTFIVRLQNGASPRVISKALVYSYHTGPTGEDDAVR